MDRKTQLYLRLLGIVGFVVVLLFLPVVSRQCGMSAPTPPVPASEPTATWTPTQTPLPPLTPTPTAMPLVSPLTSPLQPPPAVLSEPLYTYRVVQAYPHDPGAFTQGLVYHEGLLYEGTGLRGRSSLRRVDLETGEVTQLHPLEDDFFGEGIAILGDRLYQLTWQSGTGFVYDWQTFEPLGSWAYDTEGWGLTHDGTLLIMSDGTPTLFYLDPETLAVVRRLEVRSAHGPVARLNELEYVKGQVYANVWQTDLIARIDPRSGMVVGWIDLSGLLTAADRVQQVDVLNGIAYDAENDRLFVTGKLWPKLFEIEVVETSADS